VIVQPHRFANALLTLGHPREKTPLVNASNEVQIINNPDESMLGSFYHETGKFGEVFSLDRQLTDCTQYKLSCINRNTTHTPKIHIL
jgi:hypothetical protein